MPSHAGRMSAEHFGAVNTPVYRASTILYPDLASLEATRRCPTSMAGAARRRSDSFEEAITALEGGARTVVCALGPERDCAGDPLGMRRGRSSADGRQLL